MMEWKPGATCLCCGHWATVIYLVHPGLVAVEFDDYRQALVLARALSAPGQAPAPDLAGRKAKYS